MLAFLSLLGVVFNWLLSPLKDNQARLESKMDRMESEFKEMDSKFTGLETKFIGLESKMDQLLALYKSS